MKKGRRILSVIILYMLAFSSGCFGWLVAEVFAEIQWLIGGLWLTLPLWPVVIYSLFRPSGTEWLEVEKEELWLLTIFFTAIMAMGILGWLVGIATG